MNGQYISGSLILQQPYYWWLRWSALSDRGQEIINLGIEGFMIWSVFSAIGALYAESAGYGRTESFSWLVNAFICTAIFSGNA